MLSKKKQNTKKPKQNNKRNAINKQLTIDFNF